MGNSLTIAIDGPASSGKSTVSKRLAKDLGLIYIDTGAMYRALTWAALKEKIDLNDEEKLLDLLKDIEISFDITEQNQEICVNSKNITQEIRGNNVTNNVSTVSIHPKIREELVNRQRKLAQNQAVIMDGRDIGTVVLPDAKVKIFLVASVEERAARRYHENKERGIAASLETLQDEISVRDQKDSQRATSPLKQADDAVRIDTTGMSIEEVVEKAKKIIKNKTKQLEV